MVNINDAGMQRSIYSDHFLNWKPKKLKMSTTNISLDAKIEMQTLMGKPIPLKVQEIFWDAEMPNCIMYGIIELNLWQRIWADGLFQLSPEVVLHEPVEFEPEGSITLELALDETVLRSLLTKSDPIEAFLYGLGGTTEESTQLLQTSSWRAYSVMQQLPVPNDPEAILEIGFKTVWAENTHSQIR